MTRRPDGRFLTRWAIPGLLAIVSLPATAHAQSADFFDRNRNVGVIDRPRPEWQAQGLNIGAFQINPSLTIAPEYDDNIFATNTNRQSDLVTAINPAVQVQSNWARNQVSAFAQSTTDIYASHSDQGTTDYQFGGAGRLDILRASNITAGASYSDNTIPRTAEDNITTASTPIQYTQTSANIGGLQVLSRIRLHEQFYYGKTNYNSNTISDGQFNVNSVNSEQYIYTGRVDYGLTPSFAFFVSGSYNDKPYITKIPIDRSSTGFETDFGADFDITRLVRGQVQFGYLQQDYKATSFHTVSGPAVHANVEYFLSGLTTITLSANRTVIDAIDPVAISYTDTRGSVRVDHELLRNVILSAQAGYETADFKGEDRDDGRASVTFSGTYLINRHLGLTLGYSLLDETSSGTARIGNFYVDVVSLSLALRL